MPQKIIRIICIITLITCLALIGWDVYKEYKELQQNKNFALEFELSLEEATNTQRINFPLLVEKYTDTVGWIYIPDTDINHPVVRGETNESYLNTDINGNPSIYGAIFADSDNNFDPLDDNIILYGHNMGSSKKTMFSELVNYADQAYFDAHKLVQFDTSYDTGNWEIFAVFSIDIAADNGDFDYIKRNFKNHDDFSQYIGQIKQRSHITSTIPVEYGDKILTLSTCHKYFSNQNNRLVVMAVLREGSLMEQ